MAFISTNSTKMGSKGGTIVSARGILAEAYYENFDGSSNWGGFIQTGGVPTSINGIDCVYFNTYSNYNNNFYYDLLANNTNCIIYGCGRTAGYNGSEACLFTPGLSSSSNNCPSWLYTTGTSWNMSCFANDVTQAFSSGYNFTSNFCVFALKIENKTGTWYSVDGVKRIASFSNTGSKVLYGRYPDNTRLSNNYYTYACVTTLGETDAEITQNCINIYNRYVQGRQQNVNTNTILNNKTLLWENLSVPTLGNGWAEQDIVLNNSRKNFNFLLIEYVSGRQDDKLWYATSFIPCDRNDFTIGGEIGGEGTSYTYVHCRDCSFTTDTVIHVYNSSWIGTGLSGRQAGGNDNVFPTRIWGV